MTALQKSREAGIGKVVADAAGIFHHLFRHYSLTLTEGIARACASRQLPMGPEKRNDT
ncbi:hypothetical protein [Novacetimonas cocois]|uniref:hypothetical protein n=1 Tax=Novacetimonas cocois TaxID=1747507 RepID=UPI0014026263|nr:hypothetical protein [Novacetimonas cocois]